MHSNTVFLICSDMHPLTVFMGNNIMYPCMLLCVGVCVCEVCVCVLLLNSCVKAAKVVQTQCLH